MQLELLNGIAILGGTTPSTDKQTHESCKSCPAGGHEAAACGGQLPEARSSEGCAPEQWGAATGWRGDRDGPVQHLQEPCLWLAGPHVFQACEHLSCLPCSRLSLPPLLNSNCTACCRVAACLCCDGLPPGERGFLYSSVSMSPEAISANAISGYAAADLVAVYSCVTPSSSISAWTGLMMHNAGALGGS